LLDIFGGNHVALLFSGLNLCCHIHLPTQN
jgi:hypothetical protein